MIDRSDAVSAEKMRVDFVANASHELRTPLSTVLGYAETLAEEEDLTSDLRSTFGRTIRDEARRMLRIIEDLMSLSRIEADRFLAPNDTVPIAEVLGTAVDNVQHMRGGTQCDIVVDVPADLPSVRGDRTQLIQVFDNLFEQCGPLCLRRSGIADRGDRPWQWKVGDGYCHRLWPGNSARTSAARDGALLSGRRRSQP